LKDKISEANFTEDEGATQHGVITRLDTITKESIEAFIEAIAQHRHWERESLR